VPPFLTYLNDLTDLISQAAKFKMFSLRICFFIDSFFILTSYFKNLFADNSKYFESEFMIWYWHLFLFG